MVVHVCVLFHVQGGLAVHCINTERAYLRAIHFISGRLNLARCITYIVNDAFIVLPLTNSLCEAAVMVLSHVGEAFTQGWCSQM